MPSRINKSNKKCNKLKKRNYKKSRKTNKKSYKRLLKAK